MIVDEKKYVNASFETIRQCLKKYNAEENDAPPKLIVAGRNDFFDLAQKRNSQFIIAVKEFFEADKSLIETMLADLEKESGQKTLAFFYTDKEAIETVIHDFEDFYNTAIRETVFQKTGSSAGQNELQFYLIIVVVESYYYES